MHEKEIFIVIIIIITDEDNRQILVFINALNTHVSSEKKKSTSNCLLQPFNLQYTAKACYRNS